MTQSPETTAGTATESGEAPTLCARGLVKRYGRVTALDHADFDLRPGEVLAVVGDNGAGKSSLIKALSGALVPDSGEISVDGERVQLRTPIDARAYGIETVYQDLALAPAQDIATNMFLGRELRRTSLFGRLFRRLDTPAMRAEAWRVLAELDVRVSSTAQPVETLSGGQRQAVAVARAAAFGTKAIIMDEPTAALGVAEATKVLTLIDRIRERGLPVVLISHNMPHVFDIADRIHVHRLGRRVAMVSPRERSMNDIVGLITGALELQEDGSLREIEAARADFSH